MTEIKKCKLPEDHFDRLDPNPKKPLPQSQNGHEVNSTNEPQSLESRTDMTELEEILLSVTNDWLNKQYGQRLNWTKGATAPRINQYLKLLQLCEDATPANNDDNQHYGFDISDRGKYTHMEQFALYTNLNDLVKAGLVSDKEFHVELPTEKRIYKGSRDETRTLIRTEKFRSGTEHDCYTITPFGKEKLQAHRVAKNAHS